MTENEMSAKIALYIVSGIAAVVIAIAVCVNGASLYHDYTQVQIAQLGITPAAKAAADARTAENKAAAERAMFERMPK
jgi:hypothetical protein